MVVWSRWGSLVLACVGLGVGTGALLDPIAFPDRPDGPVVRMPVRTGPMAAAVSPCLLDRFVLTPHLDEPRQQSVLEPLPQRVGSQTYRQVPATPDGPA